MRDLYDTLENWQNANQKRFLSMSIEKDSSRFCCIALTNPTEVVITDEDGKCYATVSQTAPGISALWVTQS